MSAPAIDFLPTRQSPPGELPRRVCLVTEAAGGGVGRHFLDLASGLAEREVQVVAIYSPRRSDVSFRERLPNCRGVVFIELPMRRAVHPLDGADWWRLVNSIRKTGPFDLVHGHSSKGGALARLAARWLSIPSVYTPNAFVTLDPTLPAWRRRLYGAIEHWLAGSTAAIIACPDEEVRHAAKLGIDSRRIHVVPNGIEQPCFPPRDQARLRLGLSHTDFAIGFVGRLTPQKNPELLIETFAKVVAIHSHAKLLLVGSGTLESAVKARINALGLAENVNMLGDQVATTVMPAFDVFCLSSRYEGMPYVLLEALAAGLPIVATRVGGATTCIDPGVNGEIVEQEDVNGLATALLSLAADSVRREQFAAASIARASEFTANRMVQRTLAVYEQVLRQTARRRR